MTLIRLGYILIVILNILDVIILKFKPEYEINPLAIFVMGYGFIYLIIFKIIAVCFIIFALDKIAQKKKDMSLAVNYFTVGFYFVTVISNIFMVLK